MSRVNELVYNFFDDILGLAARLGIPMMISAWFLVLIVMIGMVFVLRKHSLHRIWFVSLVVGCTSLIAHMLDFFGTLSICPDLSFEANPIWNLVVEYMGLNIARWYGFTGKLFLSVLSFEFMAYYLIKRKELFPDAAQGFFQFWQRFGKGARDAKNLVFTRIMNLFSFLFALIGPFCFYIAFLNSIDDLSWYMRMPAMPLVLIVYIVILVFIYLIGNYWSFKHTRK